MRSSLLCCFPVIFFFIAEISFSAPESLEDNSETAACWNWDTFNKHICFDSKGITSICEIPLGLFLVVWSLCLDEPSTISDLLTACGLWFLSDGITQKFNEYYDNDNRIIAHDLYKNTASLKSNDYRKSRIQTFQFFSSIINSIGAYNLVMLCNENIGKMTSQGVNPLALSFDENIEWSEDAGFFQVPLASSILLVVGLSSLGYNIYELIKNIKNNEINEQDRTIFYILNGIILGYNCEPFRIWLLPSYCQNMLGIEAQVLEDAHLYNDPLQKALFIDAVNYCLSYKGYEPIQVRLVAGYAKMLIIEGSINMGQKVYYRLWSNVKNKIRLGRY